MTVLYLIVNNNNNNKYQLFYNIAKIICKSFGMQRKSESTSFGG